MASELDRARMQMQDRLLRDGHLSSSERLVGIWLLSCVNRVCGYAWPSTNRAATELSLSVRTVKNANFKLERLGYFHIERNVRGGTNHYWPCFDRGANSVSPPVIEGAAKNEMVGVKNERVWGAKNIPQSLPSRSLRIPSTEDAPQVTPSGSAGGSRREQNSEMRTHKGDEQLERQISQALGPDGDEILGTLYSIDEGRAYYNMIAAARRGETSARELCAARLVYEQRRPPISASSEILRQDRRAPGTSDQEGGWHLEPSAQALTSAASVGSR